MKKTAILLLLVLVSLVVTVTACGTNPATSGENTSTEAPEESTATTTPTTTTTPGGNETPKGTYQNTEWDGKTLKVLAIGNSFSDDSMEWLYKIADAEGVENIILGNLYWGGCDLQTHVNNALNSVAQYSYRKNVNDRWVTRENSTIEYGILDEDWDIITMQQVSGKSGLSNTYRPYLQQLVDYVNETKTNPNCRFAWNMTWAYQSDSTHGDFPNYNRDQMRMYNAIVNSVKTNIVPRNDFPIILTPGTAIQNVRSSYIGDTLTRDGYHLNYDIGRYIAGYTWFRILTGQELTELKYTHNLDQGSLDIILEAVNAAATNPFEVTQSSYTEFEIDMNQYTEIEFDYTVGGYWNSTDSTRFNRVITDDTPTSPNFIATQLFNQKTLPVGSLIVVDDGYQYRPEAWTSENIQNSRPEPTTNKYFFITDSWWTNYQFRAFNISVVNNARQVTEEDAAHLHIYVPKNVTIPDTEVKFQGDNTPDVTFIDQSPNANTGKLAIGNFIEDSTSPNGYAIDGYFMSGDNGGKINTALSGANNFTLGAYVRLEDLKANNVILAKGDRQVTIKIDANGNLEFFTYTVETQWAPIITVNPSTAGIAANQWVYVVGVRDGADLRLYVNGKLVGEAHNASGTVNTESVELGIGADPTANRYGRNSYAYAHILPFAATEDQIKATYDALKNGTTPAYTEQDAVVWYDASKFEKND